MDRDSWLKTRPYLRPIARFCRQVEEAAAKLPPDVAPIPDWDDYRVDFQKGVPLLQSPGVAIDLEPAGRMAIALIGQLASSSLDGGLGADVRSLSEELRGDAAAARRISSGLIGDREFGSSRPGLLRYLAWVAAGRYLRPALDAFAAVRDEERWLKKYCPTCASPPAMAQLIGIDPGRMRFLVCGCCGTRWRYSRTGCPFCEADTGRIAVVTVENEGGLRIDYCESCKAYLKTCDGQKDESLLLADWSSLHLDVAAQDRGLRRQAASMFEFDVGGAKPLGKAAP